MPTSRSEAKKIYAIMNDFLSLSDAVEITLRLDEEVGQKSENDSLKISLKMLRNLYSQEGPGNA